MYKDEITKSNDNEILFYLYIYGLNLSKSKPIYITLHWLNGPLSGEPKSFTHLNAQDNLYSLCLP